MESIPDEIRDDCYLHTIDGNFVGEAQYDHIIESLLEPVNPGRTFIPNPLKVDINFWQP